MEEPAEGFLTRLAEVMGESAYAFSKKSGIAESLLRKYLHGVSEPGMDKLRRISEVGGVTLDWLVFGRGDKQSDASRQRSTAFNGIPVVSRVAAGSMVAHYITEHAEEYVPIDAARLVPGLGDVLFGLRVEGDSMETWMYDGDIVICSAVQTPLVRDDVVFYKFSTGEATIKRLLSKDEKRKRLRLLPLNPELDDFTVLWEPQDQLFKVLYIVRDTRKRRRSTMDAMVN